MATIEGILLRRKGRYDAIVVGGGIYGAMLACGDPDEA
jgi:glycerol-3-phosphate dehydrogenase